MRTPLWLTDLLNAGFNPRERSGLELDRIRMINVGLLVILTIALPFGAQYLLLGVPVVSVAVLVTCSGAVGVMWLIRRGFSVVLAGYLAGSLVFLLLLISNLNSGGFYDPNFSWFYVLPLIGAVLVDSRAAWVWSIVIVATTAAFWIAQELGVVVPNNIPGDLHPIHSLLNRLTALAAFAVLVILFVRSHARATNAAFRLAHFDELSGLPNRRALMKRLEAEVAESSEDATCALLFVDLDRFKTINDSLGHRVGDQLLAALAKRISEVVERFDEGPEDGRLVARFGGDEFAVIAARLDDAVSAKRLGTAIVDALNKEVLVGDYHLHSGASVGVACSPDDGANAGELLQSADLAMYRAKGLGGSQVAFCDQELVAASRRWMQLEGGLHHAIEKRELSLAFQPIVCLETEQITAVEALLRWKPDDHESVSPAEFIPVAEATGAIHAIGAWVLHESHRAAIEIFQHCEAPIRVSVNVSGAQLRSVELLEAIRVIIDDVELEPGWLELELTESILLEDFELVTELMEELAEAGIEFAIDDFGTGYSSLSYLAGLPANRLKVDREFVASATNSDRQLEVTSAIFAMAERLNLPTVAEGIESRAAADLVKGLGCIEGQGNFFSKPVPLKDLLALLHGDAICSGTG